MNDCLHRTARKYCGVTSSYYPRSYNIAGVITPFTPVVLTPMNQTQQSTPTQISVLLLSLVFVLHNNRQTSSWSITLVVGYDM